jgi:phosphatidylglycerol:prolipoprotein diacylglycerol transferase
MTFVIPYPSIDPILFEFGPIIIRWYALAYISGLLLGMWYMRKLSTFPPQVIQDRDIDDFLVGATLGVILGGRLGYVVFYKPEFYFNNPLAILQVWQGGMSFHGGFLGVVAATILFARRRGIDVLIFGDLIACAAPIGLFFGRIANFVNGELFGRATDMPWAMIFPRGGPIARHPSQLYEAGLEGLVLFCVLGFLYRSEARRRRRGFFIGIFLVGYSVARGFVEFFRQPDAFLGVLFGGLTMGQLLSLPILLVGIWAILRTRNEIRD